MLGFNRKSCLPRIKKVLLSTLLVGTMQLITACDSPRSSSNDDITSQMSDTGENVVEKDDSLSKNPMSTNSTIAVIEQNTEVTSLLDDKTVNPSGYQNLSFGQVITPNLLARLGLIKEESDNEQCYYVSNPKLNYVDKDYGKRASVLYQIIDDKVALMTIRDPNMPFYTGINVGDSVKKVMKVHNDNLIYEVDKYAVDGDYYNLIANVNFEVIKENELGESLNEDNIKLFNEEDGLPLQIKYYIKGGQKLNSYQIKATEWTADNKDRLMGQVESIDIGIPEAIYLVEGCS